MYLVLTILWLLLGPLVHGRKCYSCAGTCHSEPCNCQMGSCEADYCFTEKKPTEVPGLFRITKGCVKRPARTRIGCDYDKTLDSIQCICVGDFCNDAIYMRPILRRNITCRSCPERDPDCGRTCHGQWCHEDVNSGASGCGYGPPSLPYFYAGPEVLTHRSKVCITLSRGNGVPQRHCICNTHLCNDMFRETPILGSAAQKSRSVAVYYPEQKPELHRCTSCDVTAQNNAMTSACKQNQCIGHYCTFTTQRVVVGMGRMGTQSMIHEKQGCLNVTDHNQIQMGCSHKWMNNEEEELFCACTGDNCNLDLHTASLSLSHGIWPFFPIVSSLIILAIFR
ncbi:unnamed protein product [Bursaphelenchus xylophilus]|uniref:(pine wood nematode) hypothetical protein n=1 Tax=Bursaphelenchus xylophilus TaxID=6326 RepID=A0A1I7RNY5_BURXY|nr:unnamed protein product [Bursaphelenchus xylophilus]CAG9124388.1 unnamed protein product [Bursaphelenchus xylophilus]